MAKNALLQVEREALILQMVQERGAISIYDLSTACNVTMVTIRRDIQRLEARHLLRRTHGGAVRVESSTPDLADALPVPVKPVPNGSDRFDVLISTYPRTPRSRLLLEQARRLHVPIISESERLEGAQYVGIDQYAACHALGTWVGQHAPAALNAPVRVLDITYHFPGSRERSRGFVDGLLAALPAARVVISVDGRSLRTETQRIVADALAVYPEINVIFAINDESAIGALDACRAAGIDECRVVIVGVGLDGPTTRGLLATGSSIKAFAAMFAELVARVTLGAAVRAFSGHAKHNPILTPSAVITADNLELYYSQPTWTPRQEMLDKLIEGYPDAGQIRSESGGKLPGAVGFVVPFNTHEWYQSLTRHMQVEADRLGIELIVEDATASPHAELDTLARIIGAAAADLVHDGETIILDQEAVSLYLAQQLVGRQNLTIITNSLTVALMFHDHANVHVIMTGGDLDPQTQALSGPVAELSLEGFRADKVFVGMDGVNQQFGLSSHHHSLAQIQRAMLGAAQRVIVLSDHTHIGAASRVRVAPIQNVHTLVTDAGISSADRLALSQIGIKVVVAAG
ncbi:MAG TPA: substrate-binding domain-containing protein [Aggregatilineaceae bacterium]|nr:substrate-binding domain-containing protein [Aggregatilineaceae bacterium]